MADGHDAPTTLHRINLQIERQLPRKTRVGGQECRIRTYVRTR